MGENQESVGKILCIDGNIGAGKSSILVELKDMGYYVFPEDMKGWGSFLDNFMLLQRDGHLHFR